MPLTEFEPGFHVGRYELLAPIASGGMASVWAARMRGTRGFEKLVAVKTILPHLANDPHFETMFLDEAWIASEIVHPNIAQVFDLGEQDGVLYLVCEWLDGESLAMLRRRVNQAGDQMPVAIALRIMGDVCAGLHAAHELRDSTGQPLQVVHRDVSPQNIVVTDGGAVKVIDFGVAKALNRAMGETVAGKLKGKVQYMAPEQARSGSIDRRADLWSVGAVLYHLLAGRVPYEAESPLAVLDTLLSGAPPPPLPGHVPLGVCEIVMQALAHEPIDRYQTAAEMQMAIALALRDVSIPVTDAALASYVSKYLGAQATLRHQVVSEALEAAKVPAPPPSDLTLVEFVTRVEGRAKVEQLAAEPASRVEEMGSYDMPTVRPPPSISDDSAEDPEPVPLVRRSKADWEQEVPDFSQGLEELRSLVQDTLPQDEVPTSPPDAGESLPIQSTPPPRQTPRPIAIIAVLVGLAAGAAIAWATLRHDPVEPAPSASPPASASLPTAPTPPVSIEPATPPIESATAEPSATPPEPPSSTPPPPSPPRKWKHPGSDVPPPPPGWESLPSITMDPDSPESKQPGSSPAGSATTKHSN